MEQIDNKTDLPMQEGFEANCYYYGMIAWFIAMISFLFYAWSLRNQ